MIHSGDPCNDYVDTACRHVLLRQGVLGIKVKIMLPWDPTGKMGPKRPLPDHVSIVEPKDEMIPVLPHRNLLLPLLLPLLHLRVFQDLPPFYQRPSFQNGLEC